MYRLNYAQKNRSIPSSNTLPRGLEDIRCRINLLADLYQVILITARAVQQQSVRAVDGLSAGLRT